jgi:hypothetical protein
VHETRAAHPELTLPHSAHEVRVLKRHGVDENEGGLGADFTSIYLPRLPPRLAASSHGFPNPYLVLCWWKVSGPNLALVFFQSMLIQQCRGYSKQTRLVDRLQHTSYLCPTGNPLTGSMCYLHHKAHLSAKVYYLYFCLLAILTP